MAQTAGTTTTYEIGTAGGLREDLEDKIWDLFADDTWALTNLDRIKANAVYHEWVMDSLAAAAANRQLEGDAVTYATVTAPIRVGNRCQISRNAFLVSGTLEAVAKAGRARESARQTVKQMRELKNDMEFALVRNQDSTQGVFGSARTSAGMESWIGGATATQPGNAIPTTVSTAGTSPGFASGVVSAPTDATQSACSEGVLRTALGLAWADGVDPRVILTNTSTKAVIDGFTGIVTRNVDISRQQQATIIGAANVYVSSFGVHTVVLHRHVRGVTIMCIDPDYWAVAFLRNPFMEQLGKTGDGHGYMLISEYTLVSRNQSANAKIVGVL